MKKSLKILIVEDSQDDALLVSRELQGNGYEVSFLRVENAREMSKALDHEVWDVVISDHSMPHFDSKKALEVLNKKGLDLPFILYSGSIGEEAAVAAMKAGAGDFISKENPKRLTPAISRELKEAEERRLRRKAQQELKESHDNLRKMLEGTVLALGSILAKRDPYTADHQQNVAEFAVLIAEEMAVSSNEIEGLRIAALLHDIGKISVPVEILNKSGNISDFERNIVNTHPEAAYDILKKIDFSWPVADIVLQHHERLDGSGYPGGIESEKISLASKILAVADVFEAMSAHRPYRPSRGVPTALDELEKNKGILYDTGAVEACKRCVRRTIDRDISLNQEVGGHRSKSI